MENEDMDAVPPLTHDEIQCAYKPKASLTSLENDGQEDDWNDAPFKHSRVIYVPKYAYDNNDPSESPSEDITYCEAYFDIFYFTFDEGSMLLSGLLGDFNIQFNLLFADCEEEFLPPELLDESIELTNLAIKGCDVAIYKKALLRVLEALLLAKKRNVTVEFWW